MKKDGLDAILKKYGGSRDIHTILKHMEPQPKATLSAARLNRWKQALLDHAHHLEATRSVDHDIGQQLKNMKAYILGEMNLLAQPNPTNSKQVIVKAGRFEWFLSRLSQNYKERMLRKLGVDDPFREDINRLQKHLDDGSKLLPDTFWKVHKRLEKELAAAKKKQKAQK